MRILDGSRLGLVWVRVRDSLWFIPALAVVAGTVLAMVAVQIPTPNTESELARVWLFGGGAEGARGVLSAIAGGLITVTGTIFSVTIIALQLASSQFTPRVLGSFMADRVNQSVLGVFIGTFTYTLLVLRTIRSEAEDRIELVPHVGVTLALLFLLVSIGALIAFINHAARSIQASVILHRESRRALARVDELFPRRIGEPADDGRAAAGEPDVPDGAPAVVTADASGYLQTLHGDALWPLSRPGGEPLTIRMELHVGAFAIPGKPLASVWPAHRCDDAVVDAVRDAFVLGPERTAEQDVEFGLLELSDIAVRALSPGINDPTTALHCIDRLTEVLAALGSREHPSRLRTSEDDGVRLIVLDTPFERAVGLAFDQIRHYGETNPAVLSKLLEAALDLGTVVPAHRRPALHDTVEAVLRAARRQVEDPVDLARIERLAGRVSHTNGRATEAPPTVAAADSIARTARL